MKSTKTRSFGESCRLDGHRIENWPGAIGCWPSTVTSAQLAAGNLAGAAARLPGLAPAALRAAYHAAFGLLLDGLAAITLLCALAAFAFLSRVRVGNEVPGEPSLHSGVSTMEPL